jgi:tripartite-type tricarboxylate transporter receptor subunit TctC
MLARPYRRWYFRATYPNKPVKIIVPLTAGSFVDVVSRL